MPYKLMGIYGITVLIVTSFFSRCFEKSNETAASFLF